MRYFLCLACSKAFLASGVSATTGETGLIALPGALHLFSTSDLRAGISAIDIAAIALTANHDLAVAADTEIQTRVSDARLLGRGAQRKCWIYAESVAILIRLWVAQWAHGTCVDRQISAGVVRLSSTALIYAIYPPMTTAAT